MNNEIAERMVGDVDFALNHLMAGATRDAT